MQRRLVDDRSDQHGRAIFLKMYGQAPKRVRPAVVEVPFHSKSIDIGHCNLQLLESVIVIRTIYRRWMPGFGEKGPYAHKRVYDPVIQGLSGLTAIQGGVRGKPTMLRLIVPDKVTALTAAQAITAALLARVRTGRGQHVRLAMLDAVVAFMWPEGMAYYTFVGDDAGAKPPDRRELVFETKDGYMIAGTVAHREWAAFCQAVEKPEWLEDPRFQSAAGLVKHAEARLDLMASVLKTRTTAEWLTTLDAAQVPCGPVLTREELPDHPQIVANELVVESEHPQAGRLRQARPAERFDGTPSAIQRPAPRLGEHTDEVLAEVGLAPAEIEALRAAGAIV